MPYKYGNGTQSVAKFIEYTNSMEKNVYVQ